MNRRQLIFSISSIVLSAHFDAFGFPVSKYLGQNPDPEYLRLYFKKMYQWHCKKYFDFENQWTKNEKEFLSLWVKSLSSLGLKINEDHFLENFSFYHQYKDESLNSSKLKLASITWDDELLEKINLILKEKNVSLSEIEKKNFHGLSWDFKDKKISVYSLVTGLSSNENELIKSDLISKKSSNWLFPILQSRTLDLNTKNISYEWQIPLKSLTPESFKEGLNLDVASGIEIVYSKVKHSEYIYRLRSLSNEAVHPKVHKIINQMSNQFNSHPDYIRYISESDFTLIYP